MKDSHIAKVHESVNHFFRKMRIFTKGGLFLRRMGNLVRSRKTGFGARSIRVRSYDLQRVTPSRRTLQSATLRRSANFFMARVMHNSTFCNTD
jgi:hypothetical protein